MTIKELQEKLKECDYIINGQFKKIQELQEQNENILNDKNCVSKEEYEALSNQFKSLQSDYKTLKELYEHEKYRNAILINKCMKLEKLKPKHNERGA
ncbi:hypothetical protein [Clostridium tetani]|uniref:hypothetical protein n=1 Tax=Clostridium tetani TaxID=1513 RepID=UPI00102759D8|nr:hypothetical protein [Clostridium tetani]RXI73907.1 hypothetical protein DP127_05175 [Clostridium tetani]BDR84444.1 hypothetical protein K254310026_18550 [Clostridium tetani]